MPFRIALSGLHSASSDLKVTGNNIANSSTTGFKKSRAEFVDVYASAYGAITGVTNGSGVRTSNIRQIFSQGNVEYTDNSTDLAVTGQGFFMVADDKGRYLTRNGTFGLDRDGYVVNATGQKLQVFPAINTGLASTPTTFNTGRLVDLQLQNTIGAPVATTSITANLNIDAAVKTTYDINAGPVTVFDASAGGGALVFNKNDPTTYNHLTATTVYDSLGAPHTAEFYFRKLQDTGAGGPLNNTWQVMLYVDGTEIPPSSTGTSGGAAVAAPNDVGVLEFGTNGKITNARYSGGPLGQTSIAYSSFLPAPATTLTTGAALVDLTVNFGAMTQYGSEFAVNSISQDGFTTGRLSGFDVEDNGTVFSRYTNGNAEVLGMVALGNVPNPQGLRQKGDSLWVESFDAGDLTLGQPGTSSLGLIQSGALESSTVEIADELVNMIVAQRNYQANAQVITTADQLTQTLLNIR